MEVFSSSSPQISIPPPSRIHQATVAATDRPPPYSEDDIVIDPISAQWHFSYAEEWSSIATASSVRCSDRYYLDAMSQAKSLDKHTVVEGSRSTLIERECWYWIRTNDRYTFKEERHPAMILDIREVPREHVKYFGGHFAVTLVWGEEYSVGFFKMGEMLSFMQTHNVISAIEGVDKGGLLMAIDGGAEKNFLPLRTTGDMWHGLLSQLRYERVKQVPDL